MSLNPDHEDDEQETEAQSREQEHDVRHLQDQNLYYEDGSFHIVPTQALRAFGVSDDDFGEYILQFQPAAYHDIGMVPAFVDSKEGMPSGRTDDRIRSILRIENPRGVAARCRVPTVVVETLGYDPEVKEKRPIDVWVGDDVIFLGHVEEREFEVEIPDTVDRVTPDQLEG